MRLIKIWGGLSLLSVSLIISLQAFGGDSAQFEDSENRHLTPKDELNVGLDKSAPNWTLKASAAMLGALKQRVHGRNERLMFQFVTNQVTAFIKEQRELHKQFKYVLIDREAQQRRTSTLLEAQRQLSKKLSDLKILTQSLRSVIEEDQWQRTHDQRQSAQAIHGLMLFERGHERQIAIRQALKSDNMELLVEAQDSSVKHLEQACEQLHGFVTYLKNLETSEVLTAMIEQLGSVLKRQQEINAETIQLNRAVNSSELTAAQASVLAAHLSNSRDSVLAGESQLAERVLESLELVSEDDTDSALPVILGELSSDMSYLSRRLKSGQFETVTQGMQKDVIKTLRQLISAFKTELVAWTKTQSKEKTPEAPKAPEDAPDIELDPLSGL
jgi:hypothetical protein